MRVYPSRCPVQIPDESQRVDETAPTAFTLTTDKGSSIIGNNVTPVGPGPQLSGKVLQGDTRTGSVLFLVPKGETPDEIRFEVFIGDSEPARWEVASG